MRKVAIVSLLLILGTLTLAPAAAAQSAADDREGVRLAVLDYVEGVYNVDPARIERSVHPRLAKTGFYRGANDAGYRGPANMTFEQLKQVAATYNKDGRIPKDAPKGITVFEVLDQTATAKLVAEWGIDYFHLAKFDGRWMIVNVVWQSAPKKQ